MTNILMYLPAQQHVQELDDSDSDRVARLEESGWRKVEKYELVAIYSPALNEHKTVLRSELRNWKDRGYYAEPTFVYHPDKSPRVVSADEAEDLLADGWYDSPAKFPANGGSAPVAVSRPQPAPTGGVTRKKE